MVPSKLRECTLLLAHVVTLIAHIAAILHFLVLRHVQPALLLM